VSRPDLLPSAPPARGRGLYYEQFNVGDEYETSGRTLFEADIVNFMGLSGVYEEIYSNVEYAERESLFQRRFGPGPLTFILAEGLAIQLGLLDRTGMALLETNIKLTGPLFLGDTFFVRVAVTARRETSKPDRGIVFFEHQVLKTTGEQVATITKTRMVRRRPDQGVPGE
jgi:acyl dehydratase